MKKMDVPFRALGGVFEADDVAAALKVMQAAATPAGDFFPLPEENDFQDALAAHEDAGRAVIVNSCGTALDLCMMTLGIGPGDEVIVPGQTFVCTATCAAARGAKVVFADIDPRTMCLDPAAVESKISARTRAVVPVHFAGHPCDIDAFDRLAEKNGLAVVYDAAHAVGTRYGGRGTGGRGRAACYSFQSNKNMTTLGEGGAVTTDDPDFAELVRRGKTFGYVYGPKLRVVGVGFNYRMTKVQAAVGLTQLAKVDRVIAARREKSRRLLEHLAGLEEVIPPVGIDENHGCHLFVIRLDLDALGCERETFRGRLQAEFGVGSAVHYPAVWDWEAASAFDHDRSDCPVTERVCRSALTLPVFPGSSDAELDHVAGSLRELAARLLREKRGGGGNA